VPGKHRSAIFGQAGFDVRFEWGEAGLRALAPATDVLVLVDVLSFTTAVDVAVAAFQHWAADLPRHLRECASGRELGALGFAEDVPLAAELDVSSIVPRFQQGAYCA
jgi:hypothetical protein